MLILIVNGISSSTIHIVYGLLLRATSAGLHSASFFTALLYDFFAFISIYYTMNKMSRERLTKTF